jgi:hypothetical protein
MKKNADLALAYAIRDWLARPTLDLDVITARMNGRLHREVARVFPDAIKTFGVAALRAATRQLPGGSCRYCVAFAEARVHRTQAPRVNDAHMALLGKPCRACMVRAVANGRTPKAPSRSRSSSSATSSFRPHGPGCATCVEARNAVKTARRAHPGLTASAAVSASASDGVTRLVAAAFAPHRPKLMPTGVVRQVIHNGTGRQRNCDCLGCRGARIIAARENGVLPRYSKSPR